MAKSLLILCLLLFSGCHIHETPEEVLQNALQDWNQTFGSVGEVCEQELLELEIIETYSIEETMRECSYDEPIVGCYIYGLGKEKIVYLRAWNDRYTLYHEFAHWAMLCSWIEIDKNHENKEVWGWAAEKSGYNYKQFQ